MTWQDILKVDDIYDTSDPLYDSEAEKRIRELGQYFDEDIERQELATELQKKYGVRRFTEISDRDFKKEMMKLMDDAPNSNPMDYHFFIRIEMNDWYQWLAGEIDLRFPIKDAYIEIVEEERGNMSR